MPSGTGDKSGNLAARVNTRNRSGSIMIPEEMQDIKNAHEKRKYLEKNLLLCPPGVSTSNGAISTCLHQISVMAGVSKQVGRHGYK